MKEFSLPKELPVLMAAPNGSRLTTADHSEVPVSIQAIVDTATDCFKNGASSMHFHVRNTDQVHVLDAGLYREALSELNRAVPNMHFQVSTETVGRFSPDDIRRLAYELIPPGISIALTELIPDRQPKSKDLKLYQKLYECGVRVQHICFQPKDIEILKEIMCRIDSFDQRIWCLFAIGHYSGRESCPEFIANFVQRLDQLELSADWSICAFGREEYECLVKALSMGGKVRVGFENSIWLSNGKIAKNNGEKIKEVAELIERFRSQNERKKEVWSNRNN